MKMERIRWSCILIGVLMACHGVADNLEEGFRRPPASARAHTWWHWMNGNVTQEGITKDLEAMKAAGLGGFQAFHISSFIPAGPVLYDSEKWHELMAHTIKEAGRLGLEMAFNNGAGWSNTGGPWITPEHSMQEVVWTEQRVTGSQKLRRTIEQPITREGYYRDIAVLAFPTPESERNDQAGFRIPDWHIKSGAIKVPWFSTAAIGFDTGLVAFSNVIPIDRIVDLSDSMDEAGQLVWDVPEGDWTVIRFGYTTTGKTNQPAPLEGRGLECDKLSQDGVNLHWSNIVARVIADAGPRAGTVFNNILIDSFEVRQQNWTPAFREEFRHRRGYDITPWLVCMTGRVADSGDRSERFLWDLRRTIADLMTENYYGRFAELCRQNGLMLSAEPYGNGFFDGFQAAMATDIPMGEFWIGRYKGWPEWTAKLASSSAHIAGKKVVGAESFTSGGKSAAWVNHPYSLKIQGDLYYSLGINRTIFHTFAHQPWADDVVPGMTMGQWGMQMNRNNTWFLPARPWFDHLARCQYLLQSGHPVVDLLYLYGEDAPTVSQRLDEMDPIAPEGYDYDVGGYETLMDLSVQDGRLVLPSGMEYRMLVLTKMKRVRPELLEKINALVAEGATVVGAKPIGSPSLENYPMSDAQVEAMAADLWDSGKVYSPENIENLLADLGLPPDFESVGENGMVWIHRRVGAADIYFVSNQLDKNRRVQCTFRCDGRIPEVWHPSNGDIERAAVWAPVDRQRTTVTLDLEPAGSVFVVFRQPAEDIDPIAEVSFEIDGEAGDEEAAKPNLEILRAWYGDPENTDRRVDVTDIVADNVQDGWLSIPVGTDLFGNPALKTAKEVQVDYRLDGQMAVAIVRENNMLQLGTKPRPGPYDPDYVLRIAEGREVALGFKAGAMNLRRASGKSERIVFTEPPKSVDLIGPWTVTFGKMGPQDPVVFEELLPWNKNTNELIKYYSGQATYRKTFHISGQPEMRDMQYVCLDLGDVQVMATVKLNGKELGLLWKSHFVVDVSQAIKEGQNELEVTVTSLWPNRLIGDERYADSAKRTGNGGLEEIPDSLMEGKSLPATERHTFSTWRHWNAEDPLLPSGLVGPVRLLWATVNKSGEVFFLR